MCRLLGIKNFDIKIHADILRDFLALSESGNISPGNYPGHLDGWGIGWYADGMAKTEKSGASALLSQNKINGVLAGIGTSKILIAHLRKSAWRNTSEARHAHPFEHNNILFAHNGTVTDYFQLYKSLPPELAPEKDSLDTEVLFRTILSSSERSLKSQFMATVKTVRTMAYTALNVLMSDGKSLFGYRDFAKHPDYYTLYATRINNTDIICSEALPAAGKWSALNNGQLIVL